MTAPQDVWTEIDADLDGYVEQLKRALVAHVLEYEHSNPGGSSGA